MTDEELIFLCEQSRLIALATGSHWSRVIESALTLFDYSLEAKTTILSRCSNYMSSKDDSFFHNDKLILSCKRVIAPPIDFKITINLTSSR